MFSPINIRRKTTSENDEENKILNNHRRCSINPSWNNNIQYFSFVKRRESDEKEMRLSRKTQWFLDIFLMTKLAYLAQLIVVLEIKLEILEKGSIAHFFQIQEFKTNF